PIYLIVRRAAVNRVAGHCVLGPASRNHSPTLDRVTTPCPSCVAQNPDRARFCMECGAALQPAPSERPTQERRVVSILFVELVGFTERSDAADPEDVRRTLVPYPARVKDDLERYGGTLDMFIGDAVMGVFAA